jgi:hypothetical protein
MYVRSPWTPLPQWFRRSSVDEASSSEEFEAHPGSEAMNSSDEDWYREVEAAELREWQELVASALTPETRLVPDVVVAPSRSVARQARQPSGRRARRIRRQVSQVG